MSRRARRGALLCAAWLVFTAGAPAWAAAACPMTSLPAIEDQVMCPVCGVPLVNAGGPQAEKEREFIRARVERCQSREQILAALVGEYGDRVLAMPRGGGFNVTSWLVPVAGMLLAALALTIGALRWRRAGADGGAFDGSDLDPVGGGHAGAEGDDEARDRGDGPAADLDEDLRRYDL